MESKIPKPGCIRRPPLVPLIKNIVPSDRIYGGKQSNNHLMLPPNGGVSNIRKRAASPEPARSVVNLQRSKMRRSRSACDIRDMRNQPPPLPRSANFPPLSKTSSNINMTKSSLQLNNRPHVRPVMVRKPQTVAVPSTSAANANKVTRAPVVVAASRSAIGARKNPTSTTVTGNKKPSSSSSAAATSTAATAAAKPAKKIPAYDFKARFLDLQEKHRALKEKFDGKCAEMENYADLKEDFETARASLEQAEMEIANLKRYIETLEKENSSYIVKLESVTRALTEREEEVNVLLVKYKEISKEHGEFKEELITLRESDKQLSAKVETLSGENEAYKTQLFQANIERKELHNKLMDLKGNIRVFCRVRPAIECEREKALTDYHYIDESTIEVANLDPTGRSKNGSHVFTFDSIFHPRCSQQEIFEMVSPLIQSALDGYNVCIFAYGQTGSGKTYTMDGTHGEPGVIPRTVDLLFDAARNYKRLGWQYEIRASFLEIYNEVLYDLLSNEDKEMEIRMANKYDKTDVYVSNLTETVVETPNELRELMNIAKMNRATAATAGNERSSRSHAVTRIQLIGIHDEKGETSVGTINLIDLAGSESPKTSIRMNETKNINRSLSELTNVILALLNKQEHVPFRNSKLTHLLMPSLGGNSKTLMFINIAPLMDCYVESVKSLRFAASVNNCKMAKAKRIRYLNTSGANSSTEK